MFNHNRSAVEVVADILRIRGTQTAIMYGAKLDYNQTKAYLRLLSTLLLIGRDGGVDARPRYGPTTKGKKFLELFKRLEALVAGPTETHAELEKMGTADARGGGLSAPIG